MSIQLSPDLLVSDLDRAVGFYRDVLGFTVEDRIAGPEGPFFAMLLRDGARLMLETAKSPDPTTRALLKHQGSEPRGTLHLYVSVPDVGVEQARLSKAGIAFEGPVTKPYGMKEVSLRDPDGYHWTLGERVAQ